MARSSATPYGFRLNHSGHRTAGGPLPTVGIFPKPSRVPQRFTRLSLASQDNPSRRHIGLEINQWLDGSIERTIAVGVNTKAVPFELDGKLIAARMWNLDPIIHWEPLFSG